MQIQPLASKPRKNSQAALRRVATKAAYCRSYIKAGAIATLLGWVELVSGKIQREGCNSEPDWCRL